MPQETANFVYVTTGSVAEANAIAEALVDERLAACANVIEGMRSLYRWRGAIERDQETVLIIKTRASLVAAVTARIRALHSYECPCIVALPVVGGNQAFIDWIIAETGAAADAVV